MNSRRRPRHQRVMRVTAAALAAVVILSACANPSAKSASSNGETSTPVSGGTFTFGRDAAVNNLDVNQQISANNAFAIDKIFEPLVSFDAHGKIIPWLADYLVDSTGTHYTFTLRPEVTFSDGTPVTADDVVFSLQRHLKVAGPLPITAPITSITATGGKEVTIVLSEAYTPFLSELAGFSNGIFPKHFGGKTEQAFFEHPIGTGPFVVDTWDPNGDITFVKNTHYWQPGKPYLDRLVYKLVSDDTQLQQQLAAGQLDAIDTVAAANAAEIDRAAHTRLSATNSWSTEQVFFNTQKPEFADAHVRRAIAMALDRDGITAATTFGFAEVAHSLIPPTIQYSANDQGFALDYDIAAAKQELAKSGYPKGFTTTLLLASGNSQRAQIAQIVQESLASIGITVNIQQLDIAVFRERFFAYQYDFMLNSGQSDAPDPNGFVTFQADPDGFSHSYWTHYTNPRVTELMHAGRTTPDGEKRQEIYFEIQNILAEQVPYIPLFFPKNLKATSDNVHGFTVLPNGSVRFEDVWLDSATQKQ